MRSTRADAKRIADIFRDSGRKLKASDLIEAGVNPLYAWLYVRNIKPETFLTETDYAERMLKSWPAAIPKPTQAAILEWLMPERPANDLHATHAGRIDLDWKGVYDFCLLTTITPDRLVPSNASVYTEKFHVFPSAPAYAESGAYMFLDTVQMKMNQSLLTFLIGECHKADRLGHARHYPNGPTNEHMMDLVDAVYAKVRRDDPADVLLDDGGEETEDNMREANISGVTITHEEIEEALTHYDLFLQQAIYDTAADKARAIDARRAYEKVIQKCASVLAPMMEGAAWLKAINEGILKKGLEATLSELSQNPDGFYGLRPFWQNTTAILPNGRCVSGHGIIDAFCNAYRGFTKYAARGSKDSYHAHEAKYQEAMDELADFRSWRVAPQTQTYIQALAVSRFLEGEMGGWIPGPAARQTPVTAMPMKQLPAPASKPNMK